MIPSSMKCLACIIDREHHLVRSPGVGVFVSESSGGQSAASLIVIGTLMRLDVPWRLCIPSHIEDFCCETANGAFVQAGDILGRYETQLLPVSAENCDTMCAPADGFIRFDAGGNVFLHPGDIIHPGDIVAVIELMKIRMDVAFDGDQDVEFVRYTDCSPRAVRRGESILEYKKGVSYRR
ncbi:MAG: hypothetical protein IJM59_12155 [Proteobacteria bacterium]|nr:hypothetical protein [Pseudomonadota bacterium]